MNKNTAQALDPNLPKRLFTVRQFCDRNAWATEGGIRHLIFHRDKNGFSPCVKRIGRRILLDEEAVETFIQRQSGFGEGPAPVK